VFAGLHRYALPHARIMTAPPRMNRSFGSTTNMMIKANELEVNTSTYVEMLAKFTGASAPGCRLYLERQGGYASVSVDTH
jgi:ATP-dependent protease ClpP protease subunit